MKKILVAAIILLLVALSGCASAAKLQEYELGGDTLPTINSIVGERKVNGVGTSADTNSTTKEYTYESDTWEEDVTAYLQELIETQGFIAVSDIDLAVVPGSAQVAAVSPSDGSKILLLTIDYDTSGYKITITRMTGTLTAG